MTTRSAPYPPIRWLFAAAGTVLQLCLGTVYAWSFFQKPLMAAGNWSNAQVAAAFSIAIAALGLAAAWGGVQLPRFGPRRLATTGGALFGAGYLLAALALRLHSLPLLYLGYGVIGGIGLGLGYVTPVATAARWFPDRKGFVTGMVVMGFGFGALLMSKLVAPALLRVTEDDLVRVFLFIGILLGALALAMGAILRNPPEAAAATGGAAVSHAGPAIRSGRFLMMWLIFFCNIFAGISIISFQSPLFQDLWQRTQAGLGAERLAAYGATLIAISSLSNGAGRFLWGALSDRLGRIQAFRIMLATQVLAFVGLALTGNPWIFAVLVCYVLLCYGGGFGTMPSFVLDVFGASRMATVYGAVLTAWSAAGVLGPLLVAGLKDHFPQDQAAVLAFGISAGTLAIGCLISLRLDNRPFEATPEPLSAESRH